MIKLASLTLGLGWMLILLRLSRSLFPGCGIGPIPPNIVFASLLNEANALKYVGDVIYATLLYLKLVDSLVKVKSLFGCFL